jgi:hypothetical protein
VKSIDSLLYYKDKATEAGNLTHHYFEKYETFKRAYDSDIDSSERAKLGARILANAQDSLRARTVR